MYYSPSKESGALCDCYQPEKLVGGFLPRAFIMNRSHTLSVEHVPTFHTPSR